MPTINTLSYGFYEVVGDPDRAIEDINLYPDTAILWTLHIPYDDADLQHGLVDRLLMSLATGELPLREGVARPIGWIGGDRWTEWNEEYVDEEYRALHIYFEHVEATPGTARRAGKALATALGKEHDHLVTTAGDWSEDAK